MAGANASKGRAIERWFSFSSLLNLNEQLIQAVQHKHTQKRERARENGLYRDLWHACVRTNSTDRETHWGREGERERERERRCTQQQVARFLECGARRVKEREREKNRGGNLVSESFQVFSISYGRETIEAGRLDTRIPSTRSVFRHRRRDIETRELYRRVNAIVNRWRRSNGSYCAVFR